eukprot:TRINITY_DN23317_c0_g1_i1.p1 TRINITY_DN23317_c0_g1~~TRINITY_DN23317_c0_g1_i1.p1  ORF type:complete len:631 (-),score=56.97 TRINITY_DN23317_c0_g1_i1:390-2282(-)
MDSAAASPSMRGQASSLHACAVPSVGSEGWSCSKWLPKHDGRTLSLLRVSTSKRRLPSQLDPAALRAVAVTEVLTAFGKHFRSNVSGTAADYDSSKTVDEIEYFLSHDWGTPRLQKVLTLCYFFNSRAAIFTTCILAGPLAWFGTTVPIIKGYVATFVCIFTYFCILLFGQRVSAVFRVSDSVFLDKLCIHQTDEKLKADGIKGLAGFLRVSKKLVVLWSPRYLSRLWCTYELAAWCYLHGLDSNKICFTPAVWGVLHSVLVLGFASYKLLHLPLYAVDADINLNTFRVTATALCVPLIYKASLLLLEMIAVQDQLRGFAIRESQCFCCTHKHIHPDSGQQLGCDRELVYNTLLKWHLENRDDKDGDYPEEAKPSLDEALDRFDVAVKQDLFRVASNSLTGALLCQGYADWASTAVPFIWAGLDTACPLWRTGRYLDGVRWLQEYWVTAVFVMPLLCVAWIKTLKVMEKATAKLKPRCLSRALSAAVGTFVQLAVGSAMLLPGMLVIEPSESFGIQDVVLVSRLIFLAFLTSNALLPPRDAHEYRGVSAGLVDERGNAPCQQFGASAAADQAPSSSVNAPIIQEHASPVLRTSPWRTPASAVQSVDDKGPGNESATFIGASSVVASVISI